MLDQQAVRWVAGFMRLSARGGQLRQRRADVQPDRAARGARAGPVRRPSAASPPAEKVYCSDEARRSIARAVEAASIGRRSLRRLPTAQRRRMRVDALAGAVARDRAGGLTPIALVARASTTLSGAVDPLDAIADVCQREGVWMHVDGAYGFPATPPQPPPTGSPASTRRLSHHRRSQSGSACQKAAASCWCAAAARCERQSAAGTLMLHEEDTGNPVDRTLKYSRPFRSLRLWLSLRVHGAAQFRAWIEARCTTQRCSPRRPGTPVIGAATRTDALHRLLPPPARGDARRPLNPHNQRLARAMQRDGRMFLAPAIVDGHTCLRACFVDFRTTPERGHARPGHGRGTGRLAQ